MTELWDVTCHMGSQCYLLPDTSERALPGTDLPTAEGWKAEWSWWLVTYLGGLPVGRQSPIQVVIVPNVD